MDKILKKDRLCVLCSFHNKDLIQVTNNNLGGIVWICRNCFSNFCKRHNHNNPLSLNYIELLGTKESIDIGKILFEIKGTQAKLPCGLTRAENFSSIKQGDQLRIFWKIDNRYDKYAIAIFPGHANISEDEQLGWVPRDMTKDMVFKFTKGYSLIVTVDYLHTWYKDSDEFCENQYIDSRLVMHCYVHKNAPFEERLRYRARVRYEAVKYLLNIGVNSPEKIMSMEDFELLNVKYIERVAISRIRSEFRND